MAYTETTHVGYGSRLGGSLRGIGSGLIMLVVATCLLWWNEGRAVKTAKALEEGQGICEHVDDISRRDPAWEGKLVHAVGPTSTQDVLSDPTFGIQTTAVALRRKVEYYQTEEHQRTETKDNLGGSQDRVTTYIYSEGWVSAPIDSRKFHDETYRESNRTFANVEAREWRAERVAFGAYWLNAGQIGSLCAGREEAVALNVSDSVMGIVNQLIAAQNAETSLHPYARVHGDVIYIGIDESKPTVGDVRITYTQVLPADVSLIAQVEGDTFRPYQSSGGRAVSMLTVGVRTQEEMFGAAEASNSTLTLILRVVGALLVIAGLKSVFSILSALLMVVPFLARILSWGVGIICTVVGVCWSLIVIALAWVFYRPLVGIALLAVAAGLVWFFCFSGKGRLTPEKP